jgi:hypothetical protein
VTDAVISYRVGWRQLPWYLAIWPVLNLANVRDENETAFRIFAAVLLVVLAAETAWLKTMGVDLIPDAMVLRGLQRRVIPWGDVTAMSVEPLLWSHTASW